MICKNCGNEILEGSFCAACGTRVEESMPAAAPVPERVAPVAPVYIPEQAPVMPTAPVDPGKTMGTVALVLGIVALAVGSLFSCLFACLGGIVPLGCAIAGIVIGSQAMNKSKAAGFKNTSAQVGLILSIVATVIILVFILINAILGGLLAAYGYI